MAHKTNYDENTVKAPGAKWNGAMAISAVVGLALLGAALVLQKDEAHRWHSYLTSFMFYLSIALGGLGFVLIQHVTRAGWSVTVRRITEGFMKNIILMAVLFLPLAFNVDKIWAWADTRTNDELIAESTSKSFIEVVKNVEDAKAAHAHGTHDAKDHDDAKGKGDVAHWGGEKQSEDKEHAADTHKEAAHGEHKAGGRFDLETDHHVAHHAKHLLGNTGTAEGGKAPFLNKPGFLIRGALYFIAWIALALYFFKNSTAQDTDKDAKRTIKMGKVATLGIAVYGLSLTFASFDWIMSLEYTWFSTIFGVIYFAGSMVVLLASTIVAVKILQGRGYLQGPVNTEHYHDLGKFMWAFMVFWTYVSFSQFMIIWYADLPEETIFFLTRADNGWKPLSYFVLIGCFALPFVVFMSRHMKRNKTICFIFACYMLVAHYLHIYWEVMPSICYPGQASFNFQAYDVMTALGMGSLFIAAFLFNLKNQNLIPVGDPRLDESLEFNNY